VSRRADGCERLGHPPRAQQVDLDGGVERRVEADGGGRVDYHVAAGQFGPPAVVQAQPVGGHVARHHRDPPGDLVVEPVAQLAPQPLEAVVAEHLPAHPFGCRRPPPGPDQQHQLAAGHGPQQSLHERGAEEPGGAGHRDPLARQRFRDHRELSTIW
jgi:hypothetical protein